MITLEEAKEHPDALVAYRPRGEPDAPEETGQIVRVSAQYVFVRFLRGGQLQDTAQACYPQDLRLLS